MPTSLATTPMPPYFLCFFSFNAPATPEIYTLSLHDALPIFLGEERLRVRLRAERALLPAQFLGLIRRKTEDASVRRSEEHTSELQSRRDLVCRLLLEKKKTTRNGSSTTASAPISTPAPCTTW